MEVMAMAAVFPAVRGDFATQQNPALAKDAARMPHEKNPAGTVPHDGAKKPEPGVLPIGEEKDIYEPHKACNCEKCRRRLYQDGSADAGVSFKAPTHIDPSVSRATIAAHEGEHIRRESYQAKKAGGKVVSAQVRLFQRTCPECGTIYSSGGVSIVKVRPNVPMYKLMGVGETNTKA
jgi:hypothetical protein